MMKKKEDPAIFPTSPSLVGKKIYLRPTVADDYREIQQWRLASDIQLISCHYYRMKSPEEMAESFRQKEKSEDGGSFVIVAKDDHRLLGQINFFHLNMLNRSAELGYIIAPDEREQGYAKESLKLIIRYLFNEVNLNKVYAQTASFNKASVKLLEALDFQLDGTLRQHHFYQGNFHDDFIYSLLKFECDF